VSSAVNRNARRLACGLAVAILVASTAAAAKTADMLWSGSSGSGANWSYGANWVGGVAPGNGASLAFDGASQTTNSNDLAASNWYYGITFYSTAGSFSLGGGAIHLTGLTGIINQSNTAQTITAPLLLGATQNVGQSGAATGAVVLSGPVTDGYLGYGINKVGAGTLVLSASYGFSGPVTISGGTLRIAPLAGVSSPPVTPNLWFDAAQAGTLSANGSAVANGSPVSSWANAANLSQTATQPTLASQPVYYSNGINGLPAVQFNNQSLAMTDTAGGYSYTGSTRTMFVLAKEDRTAVYGRLLSLTNGNTATSGNPNGLDWADPENVILCFNNDANTVGPDRNNTWALTPAAIPLGVASVIGSVDDGQNMGVWLNGNQGPTVSTTGFGNYNTHQVGLGTWLVPYSWLYSPYSGMSGFLGEVMVYDTALSAADRQAVLSYLQAKWSTAYMASVNISGSGTLDLGGSRWLSAGSLAGDAGTTVALGTGTLQVGTNSGAGSYTFAGTITGSSGSLAVIGPRRLVLSGTANTYGGGTTVNGGVLSFAAAGSLGTGSLAILNSGTLQWTTGNTADISMRTVLLGPGSANFDTNGDTVTLANSIGAGGSGSLVKIGTGTLVLGGSNSYSGGTFVSSGTVQLAGTGAAGSGPLTVASGASLTLGTGSGPTIGPVSISAGGTVDLNGQSQSLLGLYGASGSTITSAASATLTSTVTSGRAILNSQISGAIGLVKNGSGALAINNAVNYTGPTVVSDGVLAIGSLPATPVSWLDASRPATVVLDGSGAVQTLTSLAGTSGANAIQADATLRPSYVTSGSGTINSLPVIHFNDATNGNGIGQYLATNVDMSGAPTTIVYVGRLSGTNNQRLLASTNTNWWLGFSHGRMDTAFYNGNYNFNYDNGPVADTAVHMFSTVITGTSASPFWGYTASSGLHACPNSGFTDVGLTAPNGLSLGGGGTPSKNSQFSNGDIGEVLEFNTALSDGQLAMVESYLQAKWFGTGAPPTSNLLPPTTSLSVTGTGSVQLGSVNQTVGSLSGSSGASLVLFQSTLTVGGDNSSQTFAGTISGSGGNLVKAGTGTLTLLGSNSYTGATTVNGGTLRLSAPALTGVPTPVSWLNAADRNNVLLDGSGAVQTLVSLTGTAGASATQADPTYRPQYVTSGSGTINGLPVIHFYDASNGGMIGQNLVNNVNMTGVPTTILFVGRLSGTNNQRLLGSPNTNWWLGYSHGRMDTGFFDGSLSFNYDNGPVADTNSRMYAGVISGTGPSYFWGYTPASGLYACPNSGLPDPGPGFTAPNGLSLGGGRFAVGQYSNGDIGEVLEFDSVLTDAQLAAAETYLQRKWFGSVNVLPATTTLSIGTAGAVQLDGLTQTVAALAGSGGASLVLNQTTLTTGGDNSDRTFAGSISGTYGSLVKIGSGTLTLAGSNTYTGLTTVAAGTLRLGDGLSANGSMTGNISNSASLVFANPFAISYSGAIDGSGTLTKTGSGTLLLAGANSYTGGTTISAGTLQLGNTAALGAAANSLLLSGGALDLNGHRVAVGMLTGTACLITNTGTAAALVTSFTGTATFGGTISGGVELVEQASGTLVLSGSNSFYGPTIVAGTLLITGSSDFSGAATVSTGTLLLVGTGGTNGSASGDINNSAAVIFNRLGTCNYPGRLSGTGSVTQAGSGTLVLSNPANAQASTILAAGEVSVSSDGNLGSALIFNGGLLRITGTALTGLGGHAVNWSSFNGGFNVADANGVFTVTAGIGGSATLMKKGSGTLVLANVGATYTGGTTIQAGTLQIGDGTSTNGSLGGGDGVSGNVSVDAGATLRFANPSTQLYSGVISGSGSLAKSGGGTLVLSGSNTFTGWLTVDAGTLQLADTAAIGPGGANVTVNGGALDLGGTCPAFGSLNSGPAGTIAAGPITLGIGAGDANSTLWGTISGSGGLVINGTGTTLLGGSNRFTGPTVLPANGILTLANGQALAMSTLDYGTNGGTLGFGSLTAVTLGGLTGTNYYGTGFDNRVMLVNTRGVAVTLGVGNNGENTSFTGDISGSGGLVKMGTGTLTLSGTDIYTGGTTVLGGTLDIASLTALPAGNTLAIANTAEVIFATDLGSAIQLSLLLPGAGGDPGLTYFHVTTSAPASVPEPGTLVLLAAAALVAVAARGKKKGRKRG
jgi:fibronectin-binding autotransporter adhesin